jgi:hypothetical protein
MHVQSMTKNASGVTNDMDVGNTPHPCGEARSLQEAAVSDEVLAIELKLDVDAVIEQLPKELRLMCNYLKWDGVGEIARCWQLSRTAIYTRLKKVRPAFMRAGIRISERISAHSRGNSSR